MDRRFGMWNVRNLHRRVSVTTVAKEMSKYLYTLDLVGVQEAILDRGGAKPTGEYNFSMEKGMRIMN
jgi:hypothetical protein